MTADRSLADRITTVLIEHGWGPPELIAELRAALEAQAAELETLRAAVGGRLVRSEDQLTAERPGTILLSAVRTIYVVASHGRLLVPGSDDGSGAENVRADSYPFTVLREARS